jgi:TPR repeat protein
MVGLPMAPRCLPSLCLLLAACAARSPAPAPAPVRTIPSGPHVFHPEGPDDKARGLALLQDGCARNQASACGRLGSFHRRGRHLPSDPGRAVEYLTRACTGDDQLSCAYLGEMLAAGEGTKADLPRAKALFRESCARGIKRIPCEALSRLGETPPTIRELP